MNTGVVWLLSGLLSFNPQNTHWILLADLKNVILPPERFKNYRGVMQIFKAPNPAKKDIFLFFAHCFV